MTPATVELILASTAVVMSAQKADHPTSRTSVSTLAMRRLIDAANASAREAEQCGALVRELKRRADRLVAH